jgi:hypothetical protein
MERLSSEILAGQPGRTNAVGNYDNFSIVPELLLPTPIW